MFLNFTKDLICRMHPTEQGTFTIQGIYTVYSP